MIGIKETKEAVALGCGLIKAGKAVLADGSVNVGDVTALFPVLKLIGPAVEDASLIPSELAGLEAGEFDELVAVAKECIEDLTPDRYEAVVFGALDLVKRLLVLIKLLKV